MEKPLRMSSYTIPVKLENEDGKYMLIHGYTGAIDIVSEKLLDMIKNPVAKDFKEDTLALLIRRGYLTNKQEEEEWEYVTRVAEALHKKEKILYKTFTWIITYNCNFRCPYCFENRKIKDGESSIVFSKSQVDKTLSIMDKIEPNAKLRSNIIILYGGEPLLKENQDIIEYIVKKAIERGYKLHVITNGYDLNHFFHLFGENKICDIQVTIDGTKDFHNKTRIHHQDFNTFDKIINNIEYILKNTDDVKIKVRVNTDKNNIEDFLNLRKYFEKKNFFKSEKFSIYSALIYDNKSITEKDKYNVKFMSSHEYLSSHLKANTIKYCNGYHGLLYRIKDAIQKKHALYLSPTYCSAQTSGYVFSPLGEIYPCWEVIGRPEYVIGKISGDTIVWDTGILNEWRSYNIGKTSCVKCKYALLCGGGCHATKHNNCQLFKRILIKAAKDAAAMSNF